MRSFLGSKLEVVRVEVTGSWEVLVVRTMEPGVDG